MIDDRPSLLPAFRLPVLPAGDAPWTHLNRVLNVAVAPLKRRKTLSRPVSYKFIFSRWQKVVCARATAVILARYTARSHPSDFVPRIMPALGRAQTPHVTVNGVSCEEWMVETRRVSRQHLPPPLDDAAPRPRSPHRPDLG